jgi:hypothetical protein
MPKWDIISAISRMKKENGMSITIVLSVLSTLPTSRHSALEDHTHTMISMIGRKVRTAKVPTFSSTKIHLKT